MRAAPVLAFLLLAAWIPQASATSHVYFDYDVKDALDDAFLLAQDVSLPDIDISRFTTELVGSEIVQTVHVVGPWPFNNDTVEIRNFFGAQESLTLSVERMSARGPTGWITNSTRSSFSSPDISRARQEVNFSYERGVDTMTFRWPTSAIPAGAECLQPNVSTHARVPGDRTTTQADDELAVRPSPCFSDAARMDGLSGECPAASPSVLKPSTIADDRDDVAERDSNIWLPHDDPTMDVLSVETSVDGAWVVQKVTLAEASQSDGPDLVIESQFRGNKSVIERGDYVHVSLMETAASGSIIGGGSAAPIYVEANRLEGPGWELRWCAKHVPADAECFSIRAYSARNNLDFRDYAGVPKDTCPQPDPDAPIRGVDDGSDAEGDDATDDAASGGAGSGAGADAGADDAGEKGAPGVGVLALVGALGLAALALRRRA